MQPQDSHVEVQNFKKKLKSSLSDPKQLIFTVPLSELVIRGCLANLYNKNIKVYLLKSW